MFELRGKRQGVGRAKGRALHRKTLALGNGQPELLPAKDGRHSETVGSPDGHQTLEGKTLRPGRGRLSGHLCELEGCAGIRWAAEFLRGWSLPPSDRGGMGVRLPFRNHVGVQFRRGPGTPRWSHLVHGKLGPEELPQGWNETAQSLGFVRYARKCMGVVPGLAGALSGPRMHRSGWTFLGKDPSLTWGMLGYTWVLLHVDPTRRFVSRPPRTLHRIPSGPVEVRCSMSASRMFEPGAFMNSRIRCLVFRCCLPILGTTFLGAVPPPLEEVLVDLPLRKNFGARTLHHQWWSKNHLISEFHESGESERAIPSFVPIWFKREDRRNGDVTFLQAPDHASHISYRDGSLWALTTPPLLVKDRGRSLHPGEGMARLYRCDDFRSWRKVAALPMTSRDYIGFCEALDQNRFLMKIRCHATKSNNEYAIAKINEQGVLELVEILKLGDAAEEMESSQFPFFSEIVRTPDHILHVSPREGWMFVFDAHTGAFTRILRCHPEPRESVPRVQQGIFKVLQSIRPTSEGKLMMVCRTRDYARLYEDLAEDRPILRRIREQFKVNPYSWDWSGEALIIMSGLEWRMLDAGKGEMVPVECPPGGIRQLRAHKDERGFSIHFKPNQTLRRLPSAGEVTH